MRRVHGKDGEVLGHTKGAEILKDATGTACPTNAVAIETCGAITCKPRATAARRTFAVVRNKQEQTAFVLDPLMLCRRVTLWSHLRHKGYDVNDVKQALLTKVSHTRYVARWRWTKGGSLFNFWNPNGCENFWRCGGLGKVGSAGQPPGSLHGSQRVPQHTCLKMIPMMR